MATANKMGALMQGSGISIEESMNLSTEAMQRAADVASIMGIDVKMAMDSVAGAAKGNFTMMDNLGVAMNATTIEAYALSKGIDTAYAEMDNATKIGLAMEMFLEKTTYATGNYAKENKTYAGSFNTLKAATSNFLSGAGGIEDVADSLVSFGEILAESVGNMAPTVVDGLVSLTEELIPQIPVLLESLIPPILEGAMEIINGLVSIFPALIGMIEQNLPTIVQGAMLIVTTLVNTILDMLPQILQLGIEIVIALTNGISEKADEIIPKVVETMLELILIITDSENLDRLVDAGIKLIIALIEGIIKSLPELLDNGEATLMALVNILSGGQALMAKVGWHLLKALINGLLSVLGDLITAGASLITSLINKIGEFLTDTFNKGKEIVTKFIDGIKTGIVEIGKVGGQLVRGLWNGITSTWDSLKGKVVGLGKGIVGSFKSAFGIHSPSKVFKDEIGKYLAQGIGVGFEDEINNVYRDMQKAVNLETGKMSANVQTSGTYQMAMSGLPTFNLLDNSEHSTQLVVNGKVLAEVVNTENRNREVATS
jgi:phage-related protein